MISVKSKRDKNVFWVLDKGDLRVRRQWLNLFDVVGKAVVDRSFFCFIDTLWLDADMVVVITILDSARLLFVSLQLHIALPFVSQFRASLLCAGDAVRLQSITNVNVLATSICLSLLITFAVRTEFDSIQQYCF